jgi:short-subunit dehydrogenase
MSVLKQSRTIVVTGAAAGVGRAIARRFASEGDRVGLISRDGPSLERLSKELRARGRRDLMGSRGCG